MALKFWKTQNTIPGMDPSTTMYLGGSPSGGGQGTGDYFFLEVYDVPLTTAQRRIVEALYATKYGITVT